MPNDRAAVPSSLPPLCRPGPSSRPFLLFAHPAGELPRLLDELGGRVQDYDRRRVRLRRVLLAAIAVLAAAMLAADRIAGFDLSLFSHPVPFVLLAAVAVFLWTASFTGRTRRRLAFLGRAHFGLGCALLFFAAFTGFIALFFEGADWWRANFRTLAGGILGTYFLILVYQRKIVRESFYRWLDDSRDEAVAPSWHAPLAACRDAVALLAERAAPGAVGAGWIDLTDAEQPTKLVASRDLLRPSLALRYEDVWWRLRLPLSDGSRLRLAGTEEVTIEEGHPTSDTDGWQPETVQRLHRLYVNLAVDPRKRRTKGGGSPPADFGGLHVEKIKATQSRVAARVSSPQRAFAPADLLALVAYLDSRTEERA